MKRYAIGLDNGGTVTKAALFDLEGREICVAAQKTPVTAPQPGYTERDMETLWQANCSCIRQVLERSGVSAGGYPGAGRLRPREGTVPVGEGRQTRLSRHWVH